MAKKKDQKPGKTSTKPNSLNALLDDRKQTKASGVKGIVNLGNTCFFNSVMQNLYRTSPFNEKLSALTLRDDLSEEEEEEAAEQIGEVGSLVSQIIDFFTEMASKEHIGSVRPTVLFSELSRQAPRYKGFHQHDAHELLCTVLDIVRTEEQTRLRELDSPQETNSDGELQAPAKKKPCRTMIDDIFIGKCWQGVTCLRCGKESVSYQSFMELCLHVPSRFLLAPKDSHCHAEAEANDPLENMSKRERKQVLKKEMKLKQAEKAATKSKSAIKSESKWLQDSEKDEEETPVKISKKELKKQLKEKRKEEMRAARHRRRKREQGSDDSEEEEEEEVEDGDEQEQCEANENLVQAREAKEAENDEVDREAEWDEPEGKSGKDNSKNADQAAENETAVQVPEDSDPSNDSTLREQEIGEADETAELPQNTDTGKKDMNRAPVPSTGSSEEENQNHRSTHAAEHLSHEDYDSASIGTGDLELQQAHGNHSSELGVSCDAARFCSLGESNPKLAGEDQCENEAPAKSETEDSEPKKENAHPRSASGRRVSFANNDSLEEVIESAAARTSEELAEEELDKYLEEQDRVAIQKRHGCPTNQGAEQPDLDGNEEELEKFLQEQDRVAIEKRQQTPIHDNDNTETGPDEEYIKEALTSLSLGESSEAAEPAATSKEFTKRQRVAPLGPAACNQSEADQSRGIRNLPSSDDCTILECLREWSKVELLDMYRCDHCSENFKNKGRQRSLSRSPSKKQDTKTGDSSGSADGEDGEEEEVLAEVRSPATKQMLLWEMPPVVVVQLKRFMQTERGKMRKVDKPVSFPLQCNLAPFLHRDASTEGADYELYGVVEHSGSLHSGHYVTYVKEQAASEGSWYYLSDTTVRKVSEEQVLKSQAYILFYRRFEATR